MAGTKTKVIWHLGEVAQFDMGKEADSGMANFRPSWDSLQTQLRFTAIVAAAANDVAATANNVYCISCWIVQVVELHCSNVEARPFEGFAVKSY